MQMAVFEEKKLQSSANLLLEDMPIVVLRSYLDIHHIFMKSLNLSSLALAYPKRRHILH